MEYTKLHTTQMETKEEVLEYESEEDYYENGPSNFDEKI